MWIKKRKEIKVPLVLLISTCDHMLTQKRGLSSVTPWFLSWASLDAFKTAHDELTEALSTRRSNQA